MILAFVCVVLNTCCVVGYTSKAGKDILIFHNSRASMDRDLHSKQPNVGYLRTYRSKSDLAYSYNRAMGISMIAHRRPYLVGRGPTRLMLFVPPRGVVIASRRVVCSLIQRKHSITPRGGIYLYVLLFFRLTRNQLYSFPPVLIIAHLTQRASGETLHCRSAIEIEETKKIVSCNE